MTNQWDCIEFVHTVGWEARDRDDDELSDLEGVVAWSRARGHVREAELDTLLTMARSQPDRAANVVRFTHHLRRLSYRMLRAVSEGTTLDTASIEELNALLHRFLPARRLEQGRETLEWQWRVDPYDPDSLLAPVVWSLAGLLTSEHSKRLRICDASDCGWLFVDESRNQSRRWCSMSDCGNRDKVRRYRSRSGSSGSPSTRE